LRASAIRLPGLVECPFHGGGGPLGGQLERSFAELWGRPAARVFADHAGEFSLELEVDEIRSVREQQRGLEYAGVVAGCAEVGQELVVGQRHDGGGGTGERGAADCKRVLEAVVAVQHADRAEPHGGERLEDGGENRLGQGGGQPQRVRLRDAARRPPRRIAPAPGRTT
jgi:hypothetical protein